MFCKNCGSNVADGTKYCPSCGTAMTAGPSQYQFSPAPAPQAAAGNPVPVLVWGIIGLAFACTFYLSILGIIFSAVGKKKAREYTAVYGTASNQARIGGKLANAGMIVGIILAILSLFVLVVLLAS